MSQVVWFALSRGFEILFILYPFAFLGITVTDLRSPAPATPRWASGLALVGAGLMLLGVVGASGLRIVAFGALWGAAALPMLWFIWLGIRLASLSVSFDDVQTSMDVLSRMDPTFGADKIELNDSDLERYIKVGEQTACRYCCTARTLVFPNGEAACGCQHSQAMRGLAEANAVAARRHWPHHGAGRALQRWGNRG